MQDFNEFGFEVVITPATQGDCVQLVITTGGGSETRVTLTADMLFDRIQEHVNNVLRRKVNELEREIKQRRQQHAARR